MQISEFKLEKWLNPRDHDCAFNLGASCVKAFTVQDFFEFIGQDSSVFLAELNKTSLHYGHFFGLPRLRKAISGLYKDTPPELITTVHGGTGANNMVINEIVETTKNVVAFLPNYQQHYAIPESLGVEVRYLRLKEENNYLPDLKELAALIDENTCLITFSNPNNPTGSFMDESMLRAVGDLARPVGAWVLSDEIYRGLDDQYMPSLVDIYEKGIVTSSMSKVFSMAGTRVGWIAMKDHELFERIENRRSYDTICGGVFDELISAIALEHHQDVLRRGRDLVQTNRAIFDRWMKTQPRLSCTPKSYTTTAFISYPYQIGSEALCVDILNETGVLLCHGDCFEIPNTFRLGYGFGNPEMFEEGLKRLGVYFDKLNKTHDQ